MLTAKTLKLILICLARWHQGQKLDANKNRDDGRTEVETEKEVGKSFI